MTTKELMEIALDCAGLDVMPADCEITVAGEGIKKVLMGVDMETAELMLAKQLGYDCVVSHHPKMNNVDMLKVMDDHILKLEALGVPRNKSQKQLEERVDELSYMMHSANSRRSESAAKLLGLPFLNIHTPCDKIGEKIVQQHLDKKFEGKNETSLQDVVDALGEIGEYRNSARKPVIRAGKKDSYAGKIYVLMSGLTGPGPKILKSYFEAGVGTLVLMHIPEKDVKEIREQNIGNVIVAGHMSSDSLGMNEIARKWAERGVETTMISGVVGS